MDYGRLQKCQAMIFGFIHDIKIKVSCRPHYFAFYLHSLKSAVDYEFGDSRVSCKGKNN
jgi:hypothetical protein